MTEYIHSGIAGKINRIVKPHIGNILVTSEFGNAKESTLTEATLKAAVNDINRIKYAVTYKGEKATVDALPTTGNTKGDMWNVAENGHNYAWTGSEWDDLGGNASSSSSSVLNNSEPYQQVFALDVTGSATQQQMIITDEDLGGQYKDILISCFTPQAPTRTIAGDAPDYLMHLFFLKTQTLSSSSDILLDFSYYSMDQNDYLNAFMFVYRFINDGGLIKGKQGKTNLTNINAQGFPTLNDTLTEIFPFPLTVEENITPKGIFITPSLPINSKLIIYARNKLNLNE